MSFLAQVTQLPPLKPNAPEFAIPFLPIWLVILLTVIGTLLACWLGWSIWLASKRRGTPPILPREAALSALQELEPRLESDLPLDLTVSIASVLRKYIMSQFGIPATRQTSQEFLQSLQQSATFNTGERELLKAFLDKCDLIEFARFEATAVDSRELWEKARAFVLGGVR